MMDDALAAPPCLVTAQVVNFDLQLGLNLCCDQHFTDSQCDVNGVKPC